MTFGSEEDHGGLVTDEAGVTRHYAVIARPNPGFARLNKIGFDGDGNPDPNEQHPVVIINRKNKQITYTGLYYYLAHFSKFVRPGAVRVQTSGSVQGARAMSFASPDGAITAQLINSSKKVMEANLAYQGRQLHLALPAVSITTVTWKK